MVHPPECGWCGSQTAWTKVKLANGVGVQAWCAACHKNPLAKRGRLFVSRRLFTDAELEAMPEIAKGEPGECLVCGAAGLVQLHHVAPRAVFGAEAELWPVLPVCGACHTRWHQMMDAA